MDQPTLRVLLVSLPGIFQHMLEVAFETAEGLEVVDVAAGGLSASSLLADLRPDVVVVDSNIPEQEVIQLINMVNEKHPSTISLILTNTSRQVKQMIKHGANYAMRGMDFQSLKDELLDDLRDRAGKRSL